MTLYDELFDRLEWIEFSLSDDRNWSPDWFLAMNDQARWLVHTISEHPPPRELKWWCKKCGWIGRVYFHMSPKTNHVCFYEDGKNLIPCGKMPWSKT